MIRAWLARQAWGLAVGASLTAAAIVIHLLGVLDPLEWAGFDFNVRHFSRIPASSKIVHIDIDDDALARVGSWPWPRDLQAGLVRTVKELGAASIVIDIVWSEPKHAEIRLPDLDRFADIEGPIQQIGEVSAENMVFPDDELAGAIREAGNVCLSMYYQTGHADAKSPLAQSITDLLRKDFELDAAAIAQQSGQSVSAVEAILAGIKREVAEERVEACLQTSPQASFQDVHKAILKTPFDRRTADRADLLAAYLHALNLRALRDRCPMVPVGLKGRIPTVARVTPPLYLFTSGARHTGFVTFQPDSDGRTRHVPLLLDWNDRLLEHLALAAAREELGTAVEDLQIDQEGFLLVPVPSQVVSGRPVIQQPLRVQLDRDGQMLINWHVEPDGWSHCFEHRPATLLLRLYDCRKQIADNEKLKQWTLGQAIRLIKDDAGFDLYRQQVNHLLELERQIRLAGWRGQEKTVEAENRKTEAEKLRTAVERDQKDCIDLIREEWTQLQSERNPQDAQIAKDFTRFQEANGLAVIRVAEIDRKNSDLRQEYDKLAAQLRPMIAGRICFIGYTATAVADMVTTPAYRHVPGVLVHSNVLNSFLMGQFRTWSSPLVRVGVILFFGLAVTLITATRGPRLTFLLVVAIVLGSFTLNGLYVFGRHDHWIRLLIAMLLTFVVWAMMVLLRYLTTEREKRRFSRAVAQYVSPAMARQLAQTGVHLDLSPAKGQVTCFFSDLADFTPLSERLGPEGTKTLLNPYLESMSAVLHRHHALINKFMGDGIFAFFNPPILVCPQHEMAACEAALDCQRALQELIRRYQDHPLAADFGRLSMRVGLASGPVFVGDYGSETKLDYTCVGDTVNFASRLESANKVFGSAIMLAEETHAAVGDRYLYRSLGSLQVKGRTQSVPVYELLGRPGEVNAESVQQAELFGQAVALFARRQWGESAAIFEQYRQFRPKDPGAARYLKAIQVYEQTPPLEPWSGGLELSEK